MEAKIYHFSVFFLSPEKLIKVISRFANQNYDVWLQLTKKS